MLSASTKNYKLRSLKLIIKTIAKKWAKFGSRDLKYFELYFYMYLINCIIEDIIKW